MALSLYYHPLASFCHKVLIALYEKDIAFDAHVVDLMDPGEHAKFTDMWPVGKMPVLRDAERDETIPETSIIVEYIDHHYSGSVSLLPDSFDDCLQARLWDRFFDLYVQGPMQEIVSDRIRPQELRDTSRVAEAENRLATAYALLEQQVAAKEWAAGDGFTIADCAAAPALFYAAILVPFPDDHPGLRAYFERLVERPSFRKVLAEAQPYFDMFPFREKIPQRFLEPVNG